jgi:hypothetical protein
MVHDWQFPNANPRGGEDRICKRGSDGRRPRFACPAEPCITVMNVHFDFWTIRKMHHLIIGKVLLYHSTIGDRDFAIERCAKAKDNSAFDLRPEAVRIDRLLPAWRSEPLCAHGLKDGSW